MPESHMTAEQQARMNELLDYAEQNLSKQVQQEKKIIELKKIHVNLDKDILKVMQESVDANDDVSDITKKLVEVMKKKELSLSKNIETSIREALRSTGLQEKKVLASLPARVSA